MENIKMKLQIDENLNAANVLLEGSLDIDNIGEIIPEIGALSDKYHTLHIDIDNVTKLDLAGIQFFYALKKKMKSNGKKNSYHFNLNRKEKDLLEIAGFSELFNTNI
jgi:anti-anti-sigma regulatory factor